MAGERKKEVGGAKNPSTNMRACCACDGAEEKTREVELHQAKPTTRSHKRQRQTETKQKLNGMCTSQTTRSGQPAGYMETRLAPHLVGDPSEEGFHAGLPCNTGNCRTRATTPQGWKEGAPPHLWATASQSYSCARAKHEVRGCEGTKSKTKHNASSNNRNNGKRTQSPKTK